MTTSVLSVLSDVLKNVYLGTTQEQLNNQVLVTQILQLDSKHVDLEGLNATISLHTGRSSGIGSRDELDDLPDADHQRYKKATYDLKYHYGRIQVSGQAMQKTKSNVGAFLKAYESELEGIKNDLALDFARQIYGNGTGQIATISAGAASATQTLADSEAIAKGYLYEGMSVDIGTLASPTAGASGAVISSVNEAAGTVIFTASVTTSTGHFISRKGNNKASDTKEMDAGLQRLVNEGATTVGGLASTESEWDNLRFDAAAGAISLYGTNGLLQQLNRVTAKGVNLSDLVVLTTPGLTRRLFESDFKASVRFMETNSLAGGFEEITFNAGSGRVRLVTDRLAPYGSVFMLPTKHIRMFTPGDWDFLAKDGQAVKWVQNKDAFQSILYRYANMGTNRRNNSLVAFNFADTGF